MSENPKTGFLATRPIYSSLLISASVVHFKYLTMLELVVNATLQLQTMRRVVVKTVSQYDHEMTQSDITDNAQIDKEETQNTNSHMVPGRLFK